MPWPRSGTTQYHAWLGLTDKGRAIKGLVVFKKKKRLRAVGSANCSCPWLLSLKIIIVSWVESKNAGFYVFLYIRIMGNFRLGKG